MLLGRVDIDADDSAACRENLVMTVCQADQLAVAVRSPVSAQEDDGYGGIQVVRQGPGITRLIDQREVGVHTRSSVSGDLTILADSGLRRRTCDNAAP